MQVSFNINKNQAKPQFAALKGISFSKHFDNEPMKKSYV